MYKKRISPHPHWATEKEKQVQKDFEKIDIFILEKWNST